MSGAGRVLVVGSSNTDLVVHTPRLPRPGETVLGGDLQTFAGGKGANQAVAAARAGAEVRFIGAFGADDHGRARQAGLEGEGVDCTGSTVKKNAPSGVALIAIGTGDRETRAENLILVAPGANARLTPGDVRRGLGRLASRDVLLCSLEVPLPSVREALRSARKAGALTVLNPAPFPAQGLPEGLLDLCDVVTPNETEFAALAGGASGQGRSVRALGCRYVLVTRGAQGVLCYGRDLDDGGVAIPAPRVKAVDTVGAGDCFNGCLAAWLALSGPDMLGAVRFAVAAAALKVTRPGAQAGMPQRREILKLLKTGRR